MSLWWQRSDMSMFVNLASYTLWFLLLTSCQTIFRLKSAIENNPDLPNIEDVAARAFITECSVLEDADGSGHTPHLIDVDIQEQTPDMPYPGGYLHILLMSFVPGTSPLAIYGELTEDDLQIIRTQAAHTIRWIKILFCFQSKTLDLTRNFLTKFAQIFFSDIFIAISGVKSVMLTICSMTRQIKNCLSHLLFLGQLEPTWLIGI